MITKEIALKIMPLSEKKISLFLDPLNSAMKEFDINSNIRIASFIAQIAHESGQLKYVKEIASGDAYEFRGDLGNTENGDGKKYKGRGLIQLTGKSNYIALMMNLNIDCVQHPELLEEPINACRSAAWFWSSRGLNELADKNDQLLICKKINGGINGLNERLHFFELAIKELS